MKVKQTTVLGSAVASAGVLTNEAGFLPGMPAVAFLNSGAFVGSAIIETSESLATGYTTATGATAVTGPGNIQNITLKQYVRLNCTAFTSGSIQMSLLSNVG